MDDKSNLEEFLRQLEMKEQEFPEKRVDKSVIADDESLEDIAKEYYNGINPLEEFSTTQLKAEIRRRKGTRKRHIKDSTELSGGHLW